MKLIYQHDSEYYSIWIKIRTNPRVWDERTDLIIEFQVWNQSFLKFWELITKHFHGHFAHNK